MTSGGGSVHLQPLEVGFRVDPHETIMQAALRQGYAWPSICGGRAECSLCFVRVLDGLDRLSPPTDTERAALRRLRGVDVNEHPAIRLACQVCLAGDVTIRKPGVRTTDSIPTARTETTG